MVLSVTAARQVVQASMDNVDFDDAIWQVLAWGKGTAAAFGGSCESLTRLSVASSEGSTANSEWRHNVTCEHWAEVGDERASNAKK
jgi:hypothetical protein